MQEVGQQRVRERSDGRRPLMIYLDPDLILQLKREALEKDTHVYLLVEKAMKERAAGKD